MARRVRVEYPGAVYHVTSCGNRGDAIFRAERDRRLLLDTLAGGCGQTGWRIRAYVLMTNHLGSAGFGHRLEQWVSKALAGRKRLSFSGEARREHDEAAGELLMERGSAVVGVREEGLASLAKGAKEKQVLACWLRKRTVVSRRRVSERSGVGDESRVTQAVAAVKRTRDGAMLRWREQPEQLDVFPEFRDPVIPDYDHEPVFAQN